eukprot:CAMPEP_0204593334 /NCGR_PEP_ID=MMETSP0661-20131031/51442_1 /ASSEMBLY_ACC=CAM_ASM_000606 /TAXON_ID=109239 /ORGANISM="Alexandrium margalefi, Strain AMGDE01CS-322" /LENGTH=638 /DNA_ID=CAMNT_0051603633 /DNA_START=38 /DNA_END=1952 /DNA_ORIENTATION=+
MVGGRSRTIREAVGRLRVRCVGASQLHLKTADVRTLLRPWSSLNPYMRVYLRDRFNQQQTAQRHTRVIPRTNSPQWREEFWFAMSKKTGGLVLHVDVMDQGETEDIVLGRASLSLDSNFLRNATRKRQVCDLELSPEQGFSQVSPGSARVEVSWEPSLVLNSASSARAILWVIMRSPNALRVLGIVLMGSASLMVFVAQSSRWLCRGPSLGHCKVVDVPGAETCACFGALGGLVASSIHFLGSSGIFGAGWDDRPPTLVELAEADIEEVDGMGGSGAGGEEPRSSLSLQVQSHGAFPATLQWDVDVITNFLPKISTFPVRLLAWLAHLASAGLVELALVLCWANSGPSSFFAEAFYLALGGLLSLLAAGVIFWHEGRLLRQQADKWTEQADNESLIRNYQPHVFVDGTGGSAETHSPSLNLEEIALRAQRQLQNHMQQVSSLAAQPLMEARQRLQGHLDDRNLMQPLLDVRQRLQGHLDEHLTQPLNEARHRLQEQLDMRMEAPQPQLSVDSPRVRERARTLPARGASGESTAWWMQPLLGVIQQHASPGEEGQPSSVQGTPQVAGGPQGRPRSASIMSAETPQQELRRNSSVHFADGTPEQDASPEAAFGTEEHQEVTVATEDDACGKPSAALAKSE